MTEDVLRSARLLFSDELGGGVITAAALAHPAVLRAVRAWRPARPVRVAQRLALKAGRMDHERPLLARMSEARRAVLGEAAATPPKLLVRVDEFPHARTVDEPERYGTDSFRRFHRVLADAGVPYLLAVVPRPARAPYDPRPLGDRDLAPDELGMLLGAAQDEVTFALHGRTHRTRDANPRRHSELSGLSGYELELLLDDAGSRLGSEGIATPVFVPPFNRFDAAHFPVLAERFDVICGGPENVLPFGLQPSPVFHGRAAWLPCYPPLYGTAESILPAVQRLLAAPSGLWIPLVLHSGWELDQGLSALARLAEQIAPYASRWEDFLADVRGARAAPLPEPVTPGFELRTSTETEAEPPRDPRSFPPRRRRSGQRSGS